MAKYDVEYILRLRDLMSKRVKRADRDVVKLNQSVNRLRSSLGILGTELGSVFAVAGAAQLARSSVEVASKMESLEKSIMFVSGASDEGKRNMAFLNHEVRRLKLPLLESADAFKTLLASSKGTNTSMEQVRDIYTAVGQASRVLQLSNDDVKGSFIALGQMMSKGVVASEELKNQLGERLPGAMAFAAKAMGTTTGGLMKMMEKGEVITTDFLPKFAKVLQDEFAGGVKDATDSMSANLTELQNNLTTLQGGIGRQLAPAVKDLSNSVDNFTEFARRNKTTIIALGKVLAKIVKIYVIYRGSLVAWNTVATIAAARQAALSVGAKNLSGALKFATRQWKVMVRAVKMGNLAMMATPVGIAVTAIALLADEFLGLTDKIMGATAAKNDFDMSFNKKRATEAAELAKKGGKVKGFSVRELEQAISLIEGQQSGLKVQPIATGRKEGFAGGYKTSIPFITEQDRLFAQKQFNKTVAENTTGLKGLKAALELQKKTVGIPTGGNVQYDAEGNIITTSGATEIKAAAPKIFNLNVDKLVETLTVQTTTLEEGAERVKEIIEEVLITALADSQKNIR